MIRNSRSLSSLLLSLAFYSATVASHDEPQSTLPPGNEEPAAIKKLIDEVQAEFKSKQTASKILSSDKWMPARAWPRFRQLIQDHAITGAVNMVPDSEPGDRFLVEGTVLDAQGKPVQDALIYLYHTCSKGWYSDKAAHISGNSGDYKHARLFTYLKTDAQGRYALRTIRPAGYPATDLPAHFHVAITRPGKEQAEFHTEVHFSDDPRLTAKAREQSRQHGCVLCTPVKQPDNSYKMTADFQLKS